MVNWQSRLRFDDLRRDDVLSAVMRLAVSAPAVLTPDHWHDRLCDAFDRAIDEVLGGRVLPFDPIAAETASRIAGRQRQIDRPVEIRDVQTAGIAAARKAPLATRNTRHLRYLGIILVDP